MQTNRLVLQYDRLYLLNMLGGESLQHLLHKKLAHGIDFDITVVYFGLFVFVQMLEIMGLHLLDIQKSSPDYKIM